MYSQFSRENREYLPLDVRIWLKKHFGNIRIERFPSIWYENAPWYHGGPYTDVASFKYNNQDYVLKWADSESDRRRGSPGDAIQARARLENGIKAQMLLSANNIPTPKVIAYKDDYSCFVMEMIKGKPIYADTNPTDLYSIGKILQSIHAIEVLDVASKMPSFLDSWVSELEIALTSLSIEKESRLTRELILTTFIALIREGDYLGEGVRRLILGDMNASNWLRSDGGQLFVVDLDNVRYGDAAEDLLSAMCCWTPITKNRTNETLNGHFWRCLNPTGMQAFWAGYSTPHLEHIFRYNIALQRAYTVLDIVRWGTPTHMCVDTYCKYPLR
jgi:aminoglycoside phosphotransferase (APT) family kinase protein